MLARKLCRWLELLLGAECENRGKRSLQECVDRAEAKGFKRVLLVYEAFGNPRKLVFLEREKWLGKIVLSGVKLPEGKQSRVPEGVRGGVALDGKGRDVLALFGLAPGKGVVELVAGGGEVSFKVGGVPRGPVLVVAGVEVLG